MAWKKPMQWDNKGMEPPEELKTNGYVGGEKPAAQTLNYFFGQTEDCINELQTAVDTKQKAITGAATTITDSNLTASRAVVSNSSGKVAASEITSTELNCLDGVTSNIQTQINNLNSNTQTKIDNINTALNGKQATITGAATTITGSNLTASRALISNSSGKVAASDITSTELGYLDGVTSNIQTQFSGLSGKYKVIDGNKTEIAANTDLNTIITPGNYWASNATVTTLVNKPSGIVYYISMTVGYPMKNAAYIYQEIFDYSGTRYYRYYNDTPKSWSEWYKTYDSHTTVPIANGGTGATTAAAARTNLGLGNVNNTSDADKPVSTATQTALDTKVDKVSGKGLSTNDYTTAEKTKLAGIATGAQVNSITGVKGNAESSYRTGNVNITAANLGLGNVNNTSDANKPISTATQTALNGKQATITGAATSITGSNLTASRALVSDSSGKVAVSDITSTELGYLDGVTSNIQTQFSGLSGKYKVIDETGISIAANTDLNTITTIGNYFCNPDNTSLSTTNRPSDLTTSFRMTIGSANGMSGYRNQEIYAYSTGNRWYRMYNTASKTWTNWVKTFDSSTTVPIANGGTGATTAAAARTNLGLGNVNNTSDANKPISTATQAALNSKTGKVLAGQSVSPSNGTTVTAGTAAEILNDYRTRAYDANGNIIAGNVASGNYSAAMGCGTTASGHYSTATGYITTASGNYSTAMGYKSKAQGQSSVALGQENTAGDLSVAMGCSNEAGYRAVALGYDNTASNNYDVAAGYGNTASGGGSVAAGWGNTASGAYSSAMGYNNKAQGQSSVALGESNTVSGNYSGAIGKSNTVSNQQCFAAGTENNVAGDSAYAFGTSNTITADAPLGVAFGSDNSVGNMYDLAIGYNNTTNKNDFCCSTAIGGWNNATGAYATAIGAYNTAGNFQMVYGKFGKISDGPTGYTDTTGDMFKIGNGTSTSARGNAFRVTAAGKTYALQSHSSSGADYAEYFEWLDGNKSNEDRRGLFVTLDGEKIRKANADDDYILGVVSSTPCVEGDSQSEMWQGMYKTDAFGEKLTEVVEVKETKDETTGKTIPAHKETRWILNPEYDSTKEYIRREDRKEWSPIGLVGKLVVCDDGTCEVNGYCKPGKEGKATKSEEKTAYRVMSRVDETHVKILIK